jgi:hypothetical protein
MSLWRVERIRWSVPEADRRTARPAGLKYTRFHTTALCSPTRAAMLTGRNHHAVGMGGITEIATSAPGYNSMRPNTCAPLAEILKLNGYSTAQFGKCHEVPVFEDAVESDDQDLAAVGADPVWVKNSFDTANQSECLAGAWPGLHTNGGRVLIDERQHLVPPHVNIPRIGQCNHPTVLEHEQWVLGSQVALWTLRLVEHERRAESEHKRPVHFLDGLAIDDVKLPHFRTSITHLDAPGFYCNSTAHRDGVFPTA